MSRESILQSIKSNKPEVIPLPEIEVSTFEEEIDLKETFIKNVRGVGGRVFETTADSVDHEITNLYPEADQIVDVSGISSVGNIHMSTGLDAHHLGNVDIAIVKGQFGVAENGAVWVTDKELIVRVLPFIVKNLIIVLSKDQLYLHMHHAYDAIASRERNFGVFISGPSKTADIEQSLVIGAQGALSLTVLLI